MNQYYIYIMSSPHGVLYTGVTNNIWYRVLTHKLRKQHSFTQKYNITRLVYYEETRYISDALAREKEIKGWRRSKKINLIRELNKNFIDLSKDWYSEEDLKPG